MATSDIRAGRAFIELFIKNNIVNGLNGAKKQLQSFGKSVTAFGSIMTAAGVGILAPIIGAIGHFAEYGSQLKDMSTRTGLSAAALAELGYAAQQTGASIETVESGIRKSQKFLGELKDGSAEASITLSKLGLVWADLKDQSPEKQFDLLARKVGGIKNPAERAAEAMKIFGKGATSLLPMIAEMDQLRKEARELGLAPSQAAVEAADAVGDSMDTVKSATGAAFFEIGHAISGTVLQATGVITKVVATTTKWIKANHSLVTGVAAAGAGLLLVGGIITGLGLSLAAAGTVLGGIATGFTALGVVLAAVMSPIGLIATALTAGAVVWLKYTESGQAAMSAIGKGFGEMWATAKASLGGIVDALRAGDLQLAGKIAIVGLQLIFYQGMSAIAKSIGGIWGNAIGKITAAISKGGLREAWSTSLVALSTLWDSFCDGVWQAFRRAMDSVLVKWESASKKVSDFLLANAAQNGVAGALVNDGGVVVSDDVKKSKELNQKRIKVLEGELADANAELAATIAGDRENEGAGYSQKVWKQIQGLETSIANARSEPDPLSKMQGAAHEQITGSADSMRKAIDDVAAQVHAKAEESAHGLDGGAEATDPEIIRLLAELVSLQREASREVTAKSTERDKANDMNQAETKEIGHSTSGTFSAAALLAMGPGGNVQQNILKEAKRANIIAKNAEKANAREMAANRRSFEAMLRIQ